jgi:hypothetical protein
MWKAKSAFHICTATMAAARNSAAKRKPGGSHLGGLSEGAAQFRFLMQRKPHSMNGSPRQQSDRASFIDSSSEAPAFWIGRSHPGLCGRR